VVSDQKFSYEMNTLPGGVLTVERSADVLRSTRVLIIKLGWTETLVADQGTSCSLGDVLRTTPVLYPFLKDHVTWLTDARAADLLPGKPYIDELLVYGPELRDQLAGREFDHVINFECDARLTDILRGVRFGKWSGYQLWTANILGHHEQMDDVKDGLLSGVQKGRTWSEILFEMVGQKYSGEPMILGGVYSSRITHDIGLNYKVGPKWPTKAWPEDLWQELGECLQNKYSVDFQQHLNDLKGYVDWVSRCRLLVTNDSLGLHIAEALGKKTVALFGPTSFDIIPKSDSIIFLHCDPPLDCQPCYRSTCDRSGQCMRNIRVDDVAAAIERLMTT